MEITKPKLSVNPQKIAEKYRSLKENHKIGFSLLIGGLIYFTSMQGYNVLEANVDFSRLLPSDWAQLMSLGMAVVPAAENLLHKSKKNPENSESKSKLGTREFLKLLILGGALTEGAPYAFEVYKLSKTLEANNTSALTAARPKEKEMVSYMDHKQAFKVAKPVLESYFAEILTPSRLKTAENLLFPEDKKLRDPSQMVITALLRSASSFYTNDPAVKSEYPDFADYFRDRFLPVYFGSIQEMGVDLFAALGISQFANTINDSDTVQKTDVDIEKYRLIMSAIENAVEAKSLDNLSANLLLVKFFLYSRAGPYGGKIGAQSLPILTGEPTYGLNDIQTTLQAAATLSWKDVNPRLYKYLRNKYPQAISNSEELTYAETKVQNEKKSIRTHVKKYLDINPVLFSEMLDDPESPLWSEMGMGFGQNPLIPPLFALSESMSQINRPTRVWVEYMRLSRNPNTIPETTIKDAFVAARQYYHKLYLTNPEQALRELILTNLDNEKFGEFWKKQNPGDNTPKKILLFYENLKLLSQQKFRSSLESYKHTAPLEFDTYWQLFSNAGLLKNLSDKVFNPEFATLGNLLTENPKWLTFCILANRDIPILTALTKGDSSPFLLGSDAPYAYDDNLRTIQFVAKTFQTKFNLANEQLLNLVMDFFTGGENSQLLRSLFSTDLEFRDFLETDLNGLAEDLKINRSSINLAVRFVQRMQAVENLQ